MVTLLTLLNASSNSSLNLLFAVPPLDRSLSTSTFFFLKSISSILFHSFFSSNITSAIDLITLSAEITGSTKYCAGLGKFGRD